MARQAKLSDLLRNARVKKGLSQTAVAEQLGLRQSTVSGWELDETSPGLFELEKLAKILDLDLIGTLVPAALDYNRRFHRGTTRKRDRAKAS